MARFAATVIATLVMVGGGGAGTASAHSLDSTTLAIWIHDSTSVDMSITVATEPLFTAVGSDQITAINDYLAAHTSVVDASGVEWGESFVDPTFTIVEDIDSYEVTVKFDTSKSTLAVPTSRFTLYFDSVTEAIPTHQSVVVLTDSAGDISTAGVLTSTHPSIAIVDMGGTVPATQMVGFGFRHVLDGFDHLLFLTTLLLPAPLVIVSWRWQRGAGMGPTLRRVLHVVTAFTLGHSLTLVASALGWVSVPSRLVEVAIAGSVAVSAIHSIRPLAQRGGEAIAFGFGLIHGLAFAGILATLGLSGSTSVLTLLAFNVGIELAQLTVIALVFPSLYVLSGTTWYTPVRIGGAIVACCLAVGWGVDRLAIMSNPFDGVDTYVVAHPWPVVIALGLLAGAARLAQRSKSLKDDTAMDQYAMTGASDQSD